MLTTEQRLKKSHVALMRHPETALYSGVLMLGANEVVDEPITAYTDGINKRYGRAFVEAICKTDPELNGLVLHEALHIVFRHILHNRDLFMEDRARANKAADYVVNDVIMNLQDKTLAQLPKGGLYDPKYHNMNMREVYRLLKDECEGGKGGGGSQKPEGGNGQGSGSGGSDKQYQFDEHDTEGEGSGKTAEEIKEMDAAIDRAIREGALLAGRLGANIPRSITELLDPLVDWRKELAEFVSAYTKGRDEYTWRKFNRRLVANDIFMPTVENETVGEIVVAIDTSGSIGQAQINEFASELVSICEAVSPEAVRVLWWDTMVHGEQRFTDNYQNIGSMLKPQGGGGTRVGCVAEYINKHKVNAECLLVFTDGFVENNPEWSINVPTLWFVTCNKNWTPPAGRAVMVD
jgi:predicted metal-dependent peptidase